MPLSIKILKKIGSRSDMIASRSWPQSKISIGRGEECTLVLEDPKKHVSRVHVELEGEARHARMMARRRSGRRLATDADRSERLIVLKHRSQRRVQGANQPHRLLRRPEGPVEELGRSLREGVDGVGPGRVTGHEDGPVGPGRRHAG